MKESRSQMLIDFKESASQPLSAPAQNQAAAAEPLTTGLRIFRGDDLQMPERPDRALRREANDLGIVLENFLLENSLNFQARTRMSEDLASFRSKTAQKFPALFGDLLKNSFSTVIEQISVWQAQGDLQAQMNASTAWNKMVMFAENDEKRMTAFFRAVQSIPYYKDDSSGLHSVEMMTRMLDAGMSFTFSAGMMARRYYYSAGRPSPAFQECLSEGVRALEFLKARSRDSYPGNDEGFRKLMEDVNRIILQETPTANGEFKR